MLNYKNLSYQMQIVYLLYHCNHHRYVGRFSLTDWLLVGSVTSLLLTNRSLIPDENNANSVCMFVCMLEILIYGKYTDQSALCSIYAY